MDAHDFVLKVRAGECVEGAEGFVEEEDFGLHGEGAGDADALFHAAGDFGGEFFERVAHVDEFEVLLRPFAALGAGFGAPEDFFDGEIDVFVNGEPGEQGVVLEDDGAVGAGGGVFLVIEDDAAGGGLGEAGDEVEDG